MADLLISTTTLQLGEIEIVYPEFPQTINRVADFVFRNTLMGGQKLLVHMEFQSTNDSSMPQRMMLYYNLLYQIYKLPIRQIVFYIGHSPVSMPTAINHPNLTFSYQLIDLKSIPYRSFLESNKSETVLWTILSDFEDKTDEWIVNQILIKLKSLDTTPAQFEKHFQQLDILSVLRNLQLTVQKQEKQMGLIFNIENDLRFQKGIEKGKQVGRQEGKQEGRQEGIDLGLEQVAMAMLADGFDLKDISKLTKLTVAQVTKLQKKQPQTGKKK
jgi:predicted transposase/invertase (TIGR01784 family)